MPGTLDPLTIEYNGDYQLSVNSGGVYEIDNGIDTPVTIFYNGGYVGPGTLSGWSAVHAEATATGFSILWNHPNGTYVMWQTDPAGVYIGGGIVQPTELTGLEPLFAADLDGDGFIEGEVATQMHAGTYGSLTIDAAGQLDLHARQCQCRRSGPASRCHYNRHCHGNRHRRHYP